jgi:hypothetical protein
MSLSEPAFATVNAWLDDVRGPIHHRQAHLSAELKGGSKTIGPDPPRFCSFPVSHDPRLGERWRVSQKHRGT